MEKDPHFLYVDDDAFGRDIVAMMFKGLPYPPPTLFADSADFITRVEGLAPQPNVFLLDVHVPPYSGFEMLAMLRAHETFRTKIVVAVTASVMNEEVALLKRAGFNGAIGKPLDFDSFPGLIASILAGKPVWSVI